MFQNIKLITSKNKHRFVAPAGVKQLTKEQWEAFSNQASWEENNNEINTHFWEGQGDNKPTENEDSGSLQKAGFAGWLSQL